MREEQDEEMRERRKREKMGDEASVMCGKQQSATGTGSSFRTVNATQTEGWTSRLHF